jgi:hypothetical protein
MSSRSTTVQATQNRVSTRCSALLLQTVGADPVFRALQPIE